MKTIQLLDGKLTFSVPDFFVEMQPEEQKKHFLGAIQPIYSGIDHKTNTAFAVLRTDRDADEKTLLERISEYQRGYSRMAPGFVQGQIASKIVHGKRIYALTFQSNALTENRFNMIGLTALEGKELLFYWITPMNETAGMQLQVFTRAMESITIEGGSRS